MTAAQSGLGHSPPDTVSTPLDSTVVAAERRTSLLGVGAVMEVDVPALARMPSLLGTGDPLRFIRTLPGVATGCEYDAGLHIQGCENGHNLVLMDGIPIYGATHIMGLFSVFHPTHFPTMTFSTRAPLENRLGGRVALEADPSVPARTEGAFTLGLFSLQGTLRIPTGRRSVLAASGRRSFINLLYGPFLRVDNDPFRYGFDDANLTFTAHPSERDLIRADAYFGSDQVDYTSLANHLGVKIFWWNAAAALRWRHDGGEWTLDQQAYATMFNLSLDLAHDFMQGFIPSYIRTYGYKGSFRWRGWTFGGDFAAHTALPQQVNVQRGYGLNAPPQTEQQAFETTLKAAYGATLGRWRLDGMLGGVWYLSPERRSYGFVSPELSVGLDLYRGGRLDLRLGAVRQHLFQTGITNLGFPVEFWLLAGAMGDPQWSAGGSLSYKVAFARDRFAFSAELYGRRLWNQLEYDGNILDFLSSSYRLEDMLLQADGWNYGLTLLLHKQAGRLTGWAGYTLGRSLRRTQEYGLFPSAHERIHELNLVATWSERRWDAGATFVAASGTPFTAPEAFYLTGGQLICQYGPHNGARVRPYIRLDLSFSWFFRREESCTHGLTVSLYNALGRENDISYKLMVGDEIPSEYLPGGDPSFAYRPFHFALRFMPGLSYFYKF